MELGKGLEHKSKEKQLGGSAWRKVVSGGILSLSRTAMNGGCRKVAVGLFCQVTSNRMKGNDLQLCLGRFRLGICEYFSA